MRKNGLRDLAVYSKAMRWLMLFTAVVIVADVAAEPVTLRADVAELDPTKHLTFVLDPQRRLDPDAFFQSSPQLVEPVTRDEPNFGYQPGWIWLRLDIRNIDKRPITRIIDFGVNFMDEIDVFWQSQGRVEHIMSSDSHRPFSARQVKYHELATELSLPPESNSTVLIRYFSRGGTTLPMKILSPERWSEHTRNETAYAVATYVLLGSFVLIACLALALSPSLRVLFYTVAVVLVITYLAQVDGMAFQWFWPNSPAINSLATPVLAALITLSYSAFCWAHLETAKNYPRINRWLLALMFVQVGFIVLAIQHVAYVVAVTTLSASIIAGFAVYATVKEGIIQLPFMLGRVGFVTATLTIGSRELFEIEITYATSIAVIRYAAIWEACFLGLAIILFYKRLRNEHRRTQQRQIDALEANLVMQNRFRQLESRAELASKIAESRSQQLADATHDIRQPMYSLRLAIRKLMERRELDAESLEAVSNNFTYLENLVDQYLDSGLEDMTEFDNDADGDGPDRGTFPVNVILDATREMFTNEATEKGISLHVKKSDRIVSGNPLITLRILNNFVSNALKYCSNGDHILVGLRKFKGKRYIAVYDTGPGMNLDEQRAIEERQHRGDQAKMNPEGKGIGLSIVASLTAQEGLDWIVRSTPGRGSLFAVELGAAH